jgi:hypothetical protein
MRIELLQENIDPRSSTFNCGEKTAVCETGILVAFYAWSLTFLGRWDKVRKALSLICDGG